MLELFIELFRHTVTFVFGVFISASFLNIVFHKKNFIILAIFSALNLALQGVAFFSQDLSVVRMIYPFITHLPLFLLFVLVYKKKALASALAISTSYLCCQIAKWISAIPQTLNAADYVVDMVYTLMLFITCMFLIRYALNPFSKLLTKPAHSLIFFGIVPIFYYVFDYVVTVYTGLLYNGNLIAIEFSPFLLCVCYMVFCTIYFKQYEEKQEIENTNRMVELQHEQSKKELQRIRQNEKAMSLLRHDMRHFLNNISVYIENGETQKAQNYIHSIIENVNSTTRKKYCSNETINMILSSYEDIIMENGITFRYSLSLPKELAISDVDMTSILSNGLENAIHGVLPLDTEKRIIELRIMEKTGKLLISLENTYDEKPVFVDGMPVTTQKEHGFGTESIRHTVEKLNGNCHFLLNNERFVLQIVL